MTDNLNQTATLADLQQLHDQLTATLRLIGERLDDLDHLGVPGEPQPLYRVNPDYQPDHTVPPSPAERHGVTEVEWQRIKADAKAYGEGYAHGLGINR